MQKKIRNTSKRDARRRALIKDTAAKEGVSVSTVEKVLNGDRNNEGVLGTFMWLSESYEDMLKNIPNWNSIYSTPKTTN